MRRKIIFSLLVLTLLTTLTWNGYAQATSLELPDYDAISQKIVNYSLEVKPGEVVLISGTPAELDLLGSLVVAVSKAGGQAYVELNIPEAAKKALMETPIEHLKITPTYPLMQFRAADCIINTTSTQDATLFADVPEERLAASRKALSPVASASSRAHFRSVGLGQTGGIPSKAYAESKGANYEEMLAMFWNSLDTDYDQMLAQAKTISKALKPNSIIKLSSEAGTDITFKISEIPVRTNCGRCAETISASGPASVWLPAGEVYSCIDPGSASGTVVVPNLDLNGNIIKNLKLTFENGRITKMIADENGEYLEKSLEMSTGDKDVLSILDIGINPNSQPLSGSDYYSWEMAGMVSLSIGNNSWAGGNVVANNGVAFHLAYSTLMVDGNTIVSKGQLKDF